VGVGVPGFLLNPVSQSAIRSAVNVSLKAMEVSKSVCFHSALGVWWTVVRWSKNLTASLIPAEGLVYQMVSPQNHM
jgi:hypothetical protein